MYTPDISDQSAARVKNMQTENVTVEGFIYLDAGVRELKYLGANCSPQTLSFGGGQKGIMS